MARAEERPDMLIIMSDQHSRHLLGCYGNRVVRTPNLDRLASEGMRFSDAYCPSPLCVPSRMAFMTSRIPSRTGVWNNEHILSGAIPTWAHVLGAAGYETSLVGRMHFVGADQRHGFENRPLGEWSARHPGSPLLGGPSWQAFPPSTSGQVRESVEIAGRGRTAYQFFDDQVTHAACAYLRERAVSSCRRPFAAVVGLVLPHCPFVAPPELFDHYYDRVDIPPIETGQPPTIERFRRLRGILAPPLPEERVRIARAAYFGLCEYLDSRIGAILRTLDETGLAGRTLVVYCSDHGEMAGEHGCWWKSSYYEGSVGVPLVARFPGVVKPGSVSDAVVSLIDLAPTLVELGGAAPEAGLEALRWDGRSLVPLLRGSGTAAWSQQTVSELVEYAPGGRRLPSRMVRSGRWKLWIYGDDEGLPPALFDLEADPGEVHDLGRDPGHREVRDGLLERAREGWDPRAASRAAAEASADQGIIAAWGRAVRPSCSDTLAAPPPELEQEVELL